MTRARAAVLAALDEAALPISAGELAARLSGACDKATVYRALHFLEEKGLAESFVLRCAARGTERYYASERARHRHWLHCEACHGFVDLGACRVEPLLEELEASSGARIVAHTLYATGLCPACAASGPEPASARSSGS